MSLIARRYHTTVADLTAVNQRQQFVADQLITVPLHRYDITDAALRATTNQSAKPTIVYEPEKDRISVSGPGTSVTMSDLSRALGPDHVQQLGLTSWLLKTNLLINRDVLLELTVTEVTDLKLTSTPEKFVWIRVVQGRIYIEGVRLTSWDVQARDYDYRWQDGRAYVRAGQDARMDIIDAELAYLGYASQPNISGHYGVSWRADDTSGVHLLTGEVRGSSFHHNYYGTYTFGAVGMNWLNNELYRNVIYGLDPYNDSNYALIVGNRAHHNGKHGIIVSERCRGNTFRGNISYDNQGHGIIIHEDSHNNLLEDNTVYNNQDGIAVYRSSNNVIRHNTAYDNNNGIRINDPATSNLVEYNTLANNRDYGVYLYQGAGNTIIRNNTITNSRGGVYLRTDKNIVLDNKLVGNRYGIYLKDDVRNNTLTANTIVRSQKAAIFLDHVNPSFSHASRNIFTKNEANIVRRQ